MPRYIDADLLKKHIGYYFSHTGDQTTNAEHYAYGVALKELDKIPTADVAEVKHGIWKIKTDEYDCEYMMCSCCKEEFYPADADTVDTTPNYCMNCGARMDGKGESDV